MIEGLIQKLKEIGPFVEHERRVSDDGVVTNMFHVREREERSPLQKYACMAYIGDEVPEVSEGFIRQGRDQFHRNGPRTP